MTTKVGFLNKDGKDIIDVIFEAEGKAGYEENEIAHYKNFNPTNIDMEPIIKFHMANVHYYSDSNRRWFNHQKRISIGETFYDVFYIYNGTSYISCALPINGYEMREKLELLNLIGELYHSDLVIDGWYYRVISEYGVRTLELSLHPTRPLIKLNITKMELSQIEKLIAGSIFDFVCQWEQYLTSTGEHVAIKEYLNHPMRDYTNGVARNVVPLVTTVGTVNCILLQTIPVSDTESRLLMHNCHIQYIPFTYALKTRFNRFIDEAWFNNN